MGLLELLCFRLELLQGVGFSALPDRSLHWALAAGTESDLLLAGGECGLFFGVPGSEGAVEVGDCSFLERRRKGRNDLADAKSGSLLLDLEDIGNGFFEFFQTWVVFRCQRQGFQP